MPPKRARHDDDDDDSDSDDDTESVFSEDELDNQTWNAAQGGDLTTFHGEVESKLPQAEKTARIRARSDALNDVLRPEPFRRLLRRAGVSLSSTKDDDSAVIKTCKRLADVFLFNLSYEINRLCSHLRKQTITEELLKQGLSSFGMKIAGACVGRHEACATMKQRRAETGRETMRGAAKEIHHERTRNAGACLYFAQAPFVRLLKIYLEEQATLEHPLKPSSGVVGCVQLTLE